MKHFMRRPQGLLNARDAMRRAMTARESVAHGREQAARLSADQAHHAVHTRGQRMQQNPAAPAYEAPLPEGITRVAGGATRQRQQSLQQQHQQQMQQPQRQQRQQPQQRRAGGDAADDSIYAALMRDMVKPARAAAPPSAQRSSNTAATTSQASAFAPSAEASEQGSRYAAFTREPSTRADTGADASGVDAEGRHTDASGQVYDRRTKDGHIGAKPGPKPGAGASKQHSTSAAVPRTAAAKGRDYSTDATETATTERTRARSASATGARSGASTSTGTSTNARRGSGSRAGSSASAGADAGDSGVSGEDAVNRHRDADGHIVDHRTKDGHIGAKPGPKPRHSTADAQPATRAGAGYNGTTGSDAMDEHRHRDASGQVYDHRTKDGHIGAKPGPKPHTAQTQTQTTTAAAGRDRAGAGASAGIDAEMDEHRHRDASGQVYDRRTKDGHIGAKPGPKPGSAAGSANAATEAAPATTTKRRAAKKPVATMAAPEAGAEEEQNAVPESSHKTGRTKAKSAGTATAMRSSMSGATEAASTASTAAGSGGRASQFGQAINKLASENRSRRSTTGSVANKKQRSTQESSPAHEQMGGSAAGSDRPSAAAVAAMIRGMAAQGFGGATEAERQRTALKVAAAMDAEARANRAADARADNARSSSGSSSLSRGGDSGYGATQESMPEMMFDTRTVDIESVLFGDGNPFEPTSSAFAEAGGDAAAPALARLLSLTYALQEEHDRLTGEARTAAGAEQFGQSTSRQEQSMPGNVVEGTAERTDEMASRAQGGKKVGSGARSGQGRRK